MNKALLATIRASKADITEAEADQLSLEQVLWYQHEAALANNPPPASSEVGTNRKSIPPKSFINWRTHAEYVNAFWEVLLANSGPYEANTLSVSRLLGSRHFRAYIRSTRGEGQYITWGNGESLVDAVISAAVNFQAGNVNLDRFKKPSGLPR